MNVIKEEITKAIKDLGIISSDTVIVHSSLKSLGYVEGGPDAVIDGILDVLLPDGTLVFPTLCQKDWANVYKNWHMDAPSDVGLLTNVFRKRKEARRSNQATHSVAAIGKNAEYITETHGQSGLRDGIYGNTPFSEDSPWEKMLKLNTKMVFLGVDMDSCTMRHYAEYYFINESLKKISNQSKYDEMKNALCTFGDETAIWPAINNINVYKELAKKGNIKETKCGNAVVLCVESKTFFDFCMNVLDEAKSEFLLDWGNKFDEAVEWLKEIKILKEN